MRIQWSKDPSHPHILVGKYGDCEARIGFELGSAQPFEIELFPSGEAFRARTLEDVKQVAEAYFAGYRSAQEGH